MSGRFIFLHRQFIRIQYSVMKIAIYTASSDQPDGKQGINIFCKQMLLQQEQQVISHEN